ncbi:MAG TPA: hypothetical protein V6C72_04045 [Chroococcales cyanobacterium]
MINLLPPQLKNEYLYAQRNSHMVKWVVACLLAIVGLGAIGTGGYLYLHNSVETYTTQVSDMQALLTQQHLSQTEKQVQDISNNFKLVVEVLSQEVLFSKLLTQIGTVIPSNAVLTGLNITKTQGSVDITAAAANYNAATQLQVNLADPTNKVFSKADILSINCSSTGASDPRYPCAVSIRALFAANNPFLFINSNGSTP